MWGCPRSQVHSFSERGHGTHFLNSSLEDPGEIWNSAGSNMLPYFKWMPSRFLIHHHCIWLQILSEATKLNIQGVVGQLAPLAESTSGSNLIGCMLTFFKECCKPTECLLLVTAHQPQQGVLRLFKGIHLFSAAENPTKPLPCSNGCQIHVADIWTDVAFSILKVIQCI